MAEKFGTEGNNNPSSGKEINMFIHHGSECFLPNVYRHIENRAYFSKPDGGLWASRTDAVFGWQEWCQEEDFQLYKLKKWFLFDVTPEARILTIENTSQLDPLPEVNPFPLAGIVHLDFEELSRTWDAIEVLISKDEKLYFALYGWDCDSILIMNPKILKLKGE